MSTAYQPQLVVTLDNHHGGLHYPSTIAYANKAKFSRAEHATSQAPRQVPQSSLSQVPVNWQRRDATFTPAAQANPKSRQPTGPSTPLQETTISVPPSKAAAPRPSETLVYHSLQIPSCITPEGGNLADFAAQMTCLFWFQSANVLKQAETFGSVSAGAPIAPLPNLARPAEQFRKWVYGVLSTTQVTQNVILLALLFIYRLKMSTPKINGRAGSEYRLLTVALMLGNKFLDDNTYTNKTWAEVSAFSVKEIHVMEVEFLSNMRYNLLASKKEWESWLEKLACFYEYYEGALRTPSSPVYAKSPTHNTSYTPIASPSVSDLPSVLPVPPPVNHFAPAPPHNPGWAAHLANMGSPLAAKTATSLPVSRKRSWEEDPSEHPAKRPVPSVHPSHAPVQATRSSARLPVPQLTLATNQTHNNHGLPLPSSVVQGTPQYNGTGGLVPTVVTPTAGNQVSLPPLQTGTRAMSTVYSQPSSMPPQHAVATPTPVSLPPVGYPAPTLPSQVPINYATSKPRSPSSLAQYTSSPMPDPYTSAPTLHTPGVHTSMANSPTFYLQQRNSPYKPVRHVNTLLYPPPSASLDQYHLSVPLPPTQMHYQPLGRRNDLRTGVVPDFVVYNRGQPQSLPQTIPQGHYPS